MMDTTLYYVYIYLFCFLPTTEKLFHVYDGFVFPHENLWNKINSYLSITGISTKESHGYALVMFLRKVPLQISVFDISRTTETVCNVYFQLRQKKYLYYTAPSRQTQFCCTDQLDRGLHKVFIHKSLYILTHCT